MGNLLNRSSALLGICFCVTTGGLAQGQDEMSQREVAERAEAAQVAYGLIEEGDVAYLKRDFGSAVEKYREAVTKLPKGATAVAGLRKSAVERMVQATVVRSQDLSRRGGYEEIEKLLKAVDAVDPKNVQVERLRQKLQDPIRNNPSATPEHAANVDQVRRFLYKAEGFYDSGQFDRAELMYEDILRIDPYNKAARRGMERVNQAVVNYAEAARDHARGKMLKDVDKQWERPVPPADVPLIVDSDGIVEQGGRVLVETKLNSIRLPEVELVDVNIDEAIDYLRSESVIHDEADLAGKKSGVQFILRLGDDQDAAVKEIRSNLVNLKLKNVPLHRVLQLVTEATGTEFRTNDYAVVVTPRGFTNSELILREFKAPSGFLNTGTEAGDLGANPFEEEREGGIATRRLTAEDKLKKFNVAFPEGASAYFNPQTNRLVVRNTEANLRLIEAIVAEEMKEEPIMVAIRTTVIDITQNNLEELGFDTMLGELSAGSAILSGGTTGNGVPITDMINGNPVSSGLRSGEIATTVDSLDSLLRREAPVSAAGTLSSNATGTTSNLVLPTGGGPDTTRSPGLISLRGIIDGSAHEMLMRGLAQKGGKDILTRPAVVTKSGENAVIQSIQEFPYPEEYESPQLPDGGGGPAVAPAHPTSFTFTNLGVSLEVLPQVGPNRQIVEVSVTPTVRDFEGFVNYGSPIVGFDNTSFINLLDFSGGTDTVFGEVTPNAILMPLFRTIKGSSTLRILDGQTIVMGGLLEEVRKDTEDKVPFLGDLPLIGRAFKNRAISVERRNLVILVNVELVDPAGNPYRSR